MYRLPPDRCNRGHPISEAYYRPSGWRECRQCKREKNRANRHLSIPAGGPCQGHLCDSCERCLGTRDKGLGPRCCRNDNPGYSLPDLGSWMPFFGRLGHRNTDGTKIECHVCGEWFRSIGRHAYAMHNLTVLEYRAAFGLNSRGLQGEETYELLKSAGLQIDNVNRLREMDIPQPTPEQRLQWKASLETRLEWQQWQSTPNWSGWRYELPRCIKCGKALFLPARRSPHLIKELCYRCQHTERMHFWRGDRRNIQVTVICRSCNSPFLSRQSSRSAYCHDCRMAIWRLGGQKERTVRDPAERRAHKNELARQRRLMSGGRSPEQKQRDNARARERRRTDPEFLTREHEYDARRRERRRFLKGFTAEF